MRSTLDMVVIFDELCFVTGAVYRDFWTCGSFAGFVAGTALCEPRSADFVAALTSVCWQSRVTFL